ncbi:MULTISPECIES: hypothetical protein [unclassified Deinococcus]|uniref:hypothetical protein n=2 Tax=Deinococcus TaxID=1298 RepID=UPI00143BCE71|nr:MULTISPECIES: hypothetical protein [unclassified Deinococcus]
MLGKQRQGHGHMWSRQFFIRDILRRMEAATEFLSITAGGVTISGFVTPTELAQIQAGGECQVRIQGAKSGDIDLGVLAAIFENGELSTKSSHPMGCGMDFSEKIIFSDNDIEEK